MTQVETAPDGAPKRRRRWVRWLVAGVLVVVLALGGVAAFLLQRTGSALSKSSTGGSVTDLLKSDPLNGQSTGRVNILLAGNSADDPGHEGAELTDSIMVASFNTTTHALTLVSVPRDLWVVHNGTGQKINSVVTQGGMAALAGVVEQVTGLHIDQQVLVDYRALKQAVDAVGGVDVTIASNDKRGIYDANTGLRLANGVQHLNGDQALQLARSRNDPVPGKVSYGLPNGDFDRTKYQRAIVEAILRQASSTSTLTNPQRLAELIDTVGANVRTDLKASQMNTAIQLGRASSTVTGVSILGDANAPLLVDYTGTGGQSALAPAAGVGVYSGIKAYVAAKVGLT